MKFSLAIVWILESVRGTTEILSTPRYPRYLQNNILPIDEFESLYAAAASTSSEDSFRIYSHCTEDQWLDDYFFIHQLLKAKMMKKHSNRAPSGDYPCSSSQDSSGASLPFPVPGNCSQFYKCDWGRAVLFSCPSELHFNAELGVCDWPWRARCHSSWNNCPRPHPKCPMDHPRTLYLPHPRACEKFYQCDWGTPRLQSCPRGLHFDPALKMCDWPHRADCRVC